MGELSPFTTLIATLTPVICGMTVYKQRVPVMCAINRPGKTSGKHSPIVTERFHSCGLIFIRIIPIFIPFID